jgi:glycosyltransferase involved in cell wall biosynthesis
MRILILTVQVPFVRGGAEMLAEGLERALIEAGHEAEIARLPFKWYPPERIVDQILAARLFDVTESSGSAIDRVIGLRFPAYLAPHPNKVLWILHQYRAAYDLWDSELCDLMRFPDGLAVRDAIRAADRGFLPDACATFTIAQTVADRLKRFSGIDGEALYHPPPNAELFYSALPEDFLYLPSRVNRTKRQSLLIEALPHCREPVRVCLAGETHDAGYASEIGERIRELGLADRVEWLHGIGDEQNRDLYARCLGVVFPPFDEDYGYVTLEAMLASKPVVTCLDSGGPLEFVRDGETGLVVEPTAPALAGAMDRMWRERPQAVRWGEAGRARYEGMAISWPRVVDTLTRDA